MYRIGVLSDTHIPKRRTIPDAVFEELKEVDLIIHAGDILDNSLLKKLSAIAPVEAVAGNIDPVEMRQELGRKKLLQVEGWKIGLIHGDEGPGKNTPERALHAFEQENPDCIVFGHSHVPFKERRDGILLFNPGSPTDPRRQPLPSFGIITLNGGIKGNIIYIDGQMLIH